MDARALLEPRGENPPSGENLEYDPVFTELELAAQPGEERQLGDEVTAAEDPDYREMREKALEVLDRSHDVRAAVYLADATLRLEGLVEFAEVAAYIRGCIERYWDSSHPELDEDDGDATMRINAVQGLCGQPGGISGPSPVFSSLRRAPLTDSRGFGRFCQRDIEIAEGVIAPPADADGLPDTGTISAAFQDTDDEVLERFLNAIRMAREDIQAIVAVFDEKTPGEGPEFEELIKLLNNMERRIVQYGGANAEAGESTGDESDALAEEVGGAPMPASGGPSVPGTINSPTDVKAALDRIIAYYQRVEPSSPIPILLDRAKRLVGADFLSIIKDMAPSGLDSVHTIGGLEDEDDRY